MVTFWIVASVMMLAVLVILLPPLFMKRRHAGREQKELNVSIFKQRMQELELEKNEGTIEADQYEKACEELERSLLNDVDSGFEHAVEVREQSRASRIMTFVFIAVLIPAMAIPLYLQFGSVELVDARPVQEKVAAGVDSMQDAVAMLVEKLQQQPDNIEGWVLLARSYVSMGRMDDAVKAYDKAYKLDPQNPDIMVDYAEMLARAKSGDISGEPMRMLRMALAVEPTHPKGLWIMGIVSFNDANYDAAIQHWETLYSTLESGSEDALYVQNRIKEARVKLSGETSVESSPAMAQSSESSAGDAQAGVAVLVTLHQSLQDKVNPEDTVFIFAQAVNGPRMPMAALRVQVKDLPLSAVLDDSTAMGPMAKISSVDEVNISARISMSGNAMSQSGDLQGGVEAVKVGAAEPVSIVIDQVIP